MKTKLLVSIAALGAAALAVSYVAVGVAAIRGNHGKGGPEPREGTPVRISPPPPWRNPQ